MHFEFVSNPDLLSTLFDFSMDICCCCCPLFSRQQSKNAPKKAILLGRSAQNEIEKLHSQATNGTKLRYSELAR